MAACVRLVERDGDLSDGMGGTRSRWIIGDYFEAALALERSVPGRRADGDCANDVYSVLTGRQVALGFHDVFRRLTDGAVFRVTSEGIDDATPTSAGLGLRHVTAERWVLPE